ncbi:MAG: thiol:disulfide interchange protein [Gammaproteobacteria bacterium SG8_47]|nr:MAG: thiol:disulfide interchange protein [Gammaproteobacteria bacterium SG8_47]
MNKWALIGIAALAAFIAMLPATAEEDFLEPDVAFKFSASLASEDVVEVQWSVAPGYYMYRDKISFSSDSAAVELGSTELPPGKVKHDEFFGDVAIYRDTVRVRMPITRVQADVTTFTLVAKSQGCADAGICYPPHTQKASLELPARAAPLAALDQLGTQLGLGAAEQEFLEPDVAFALSTEVQDADTVIARWNIAEGYYLYRDKFKFELVDATGVSLAQAVLPEGEIKNDEFFGRIAVFHHGVDAALKLQRTSKAAADITLKLTYQGCAEAGICYPPIKKEVKLALPAAGTVTTEAAGIAPTPLQSAQEFVSEQDSIAQSLAAGSMWVTIASFFGFGLLLAFTPCVFPMIPILSSIIVGQGGEMTTRKAFTMSLVYVLAMALTYTAAGVIAGLVGENLQAAFQNPWVLVSFAAIFVALAFSMFGFYDLQMPSFIQSRLTEISNRQQGGSLAGVAIMGFLSALIVGPCVAAPLAGALIYIGQTGDAVLGGLALFALSLGMGAPLVAIGTSAGKLLPRAGGWMDAVKGVFGVLLLAVAVWMLERVLPAQVIMMLWAALLIVSAIYMGAMETLGAEASGWRKLWKGLGTVLLVYGALLVIGAAAGGKDPLQPLAGLSVGDGQHGQAEHISFKRIKTVEDLQAEVAAANAAGKSAMLDFYADWCVSCKEFEKYTFADAGVQQALAQTVLLQADVTANDDEDKALLKHFKLIGPPSILFFGKDGVERRNYRVVGFMGADQFRAHVQQALR